MADEFKVKTEQIIGKTIEEIAITEKAVVIKMEDNTFLDIYLDPSGHRLKTSTNKLNE